MKTYHKVGAWLSTLPMLLIPAATFAQLSKGQADLKKIGDQVGDGGDKELPELIGNMIAVLLSVLGIFFVIIVVYAGFLYLSAGGEEEKVKKAKKLLGQAVIGIVIILLAYSISAFVIGSLSSVVA
jgi:amino acid transporter